MTKPLDEKVIALRALAYVCGQSEARVTQVIDQLLASYRPALSTTRQRRSNAGLLSEVEWIVLRHVLVGLSNKHIALQTGVSRRYIEMKVSGIVRKLQCRRRRHIPFSYWGSVVSTYQRLFVRWVALVCLTPRVQWFWEVAIYHCVVLHKEALGKYA